MKDPIQLPHENGQTKNRSSVFAPLKSILPVTPEQPAAALENASGELAPIASPQPTVAPSGSKTLEDGK